MITMLLENKGAGLRVLSMIVVTICGPGDITNNATSAASTVRFNSEPRESIVVVIFFTLYSIPAHSIFDRLSRPPRESSP